MKIVGFESNEGLRLGVVEGDNVIDLQAVDAKVPSNLADVLAQSNGDLKALGDLAKSAPAGARKPLKGLKFGLPVARPPKNICLGLNYLEHVKEGFNRDNVPKFPTIFFRCQTSLVPHRQPIVRPKVSDTLDYEAEMVVVIGKKARHLTMDNAYSCIAGYSVLQRRLGARIPAQDHAVGHGQELRQDRRLRPLDGHRRRSAARRQGPEDPDPPQRHRPCSRTTPTT